MVHTFSHGSLDGSSWLDTCHPKQTYQTKCYVGSLDVGSLVPLCADFQINVIYEYGWTPCDTLNQELMDVIRTAKRCVCDFICSRPLEQNHVSDSLSVQWFSFPKIANIFENISERNIIVLCCILKWCIAYYTVTVFCLFEGTPFQRHHDPCTSHEWLTTS